MSEARDEYYNGSHDSCCEYAEEYIKELEQQKAELIEALKGFCDRVENGEVRSVNTYKKFRELLKKYSGE